MLSGIAVAIFSLDGKWFGTSLGRNDTQYRLPRGMAGMNLSDRPAGKDGCKRVSSNTFSRNWESYLRRIPVPDAISLLTMFCRKGNVTQHPGTANNGVGRALGDGIWFHKSVYHSQTIAGIYFGTEMNQSSLRHLLSHRHQILPVDLAFHLRAQSKQALA